LETWERLKVSGKMRCVMFSPCRGIILHWRRSPCFMFNFDGWIKHLSKYQASGISMFFMRWNINTKSHTLHEQKMSCLTWVTVNFFFFC
jgi:hypothetical protein